MNYDRHLLKMCLLMLLGPGVVAVAPGVGLAQNADELAKKAEGELRRSKSSLMSGKYQEVFDKLIEIDAVIAQIQATAPGHPSLQKLIPAFIEQKEKVEQKLGKAIPATASLGLQAAPPAQQKAPSGQPAPTKATPLPYDARRPMDQFRMHLSSFESAQQELATAQGDNYRMAVQRMGRRVDDMAASLEEARKIAASKGVTSHPSFDEADAKLTAARQASAKVQNEFKEQAAAAAATQQAVSSDIEGMKALRDRLQNDVFSKASGAVVYYNEPAQVEALLATIEDFEKNQKANVEKAVSEFEAKYGKTREEVEKKTGDWQASNAYGQLRDGLANVGKTRVVMASDLTKKYESEFGRIGGIADFYKVKHATDCKRFIDMAVRFDPQNQAARSAQAGHTKRAEAALKEFFAGVDKRKWPGNSSNAPSNAGQLAQAAMKFFREDIGWGQRDKNPSAQDKEPRRPLAVAITGPWSVQERNILGNPIMYGVPALVAVELAGEKEMNLARVYDVTMRTEQKEGAQQAPPFVSITVGNSYYIRPSAVR